MNYKNISGSEREDRNYEPILGCGSVEAESDSGFDWKKISANVGKGLVGLVSMPLAGALLGKGNRVCVALAGACVSSVLSLYVIGHRNIQGREIYTNPTSGINLELELELNRPRNYFLPALAEVINSPLIFYADAGSFAYTKLRVREKDVYTIKGTDVVEFSNGRYSLNFPEDRRFYIRRGLIEGPLEAKDRVNKCELQLSEAISKGDIKATQRAREAYEQAKMTLAGVNDRYNEVKSAFERTVSEMNSELETLARGK